MSLVRQSLSSPVEHVTEPGVPDPASDPHSVAQPVAGPAVQVPARVEIDQVKKAANILLERYHSKGFEDRHIGRV